MKIEHQRCLGCEFYYTHMKSIPQRFHGIMAHFGKNYCYKLKKAKNIGSRERVRDGRPLWCPLDHCVTRCAECGHTRRINENEICVSCYKKENKNTNLVWKEGKNNEA